MAESTILLVEDSPSDARLTQRVFSMAGIFNPLQIVEDGDKAMEYLTGIGNYCNRERYPLPVLILLDLQLPRCSGQEVLQWLKQQPNLKRLPVVIFTSSRLEADVKGAYDLGANSYLVKPVGFDKLQSMAKTVHQYWLSLNELPEI